LIKTYKYRLYPTRDQKNSIDWQIELHRRLYNSALEHRITCYKHFSQSINYHEQATSLKQLREENNDFLVCNFSSLQQTLRRLDKAYKSFFSRITRGETAGFPRFKGKDRYNTIQYGSFGDGCSIKNNRLRLQNIGEVKVKWHRPLIGKTKTVYITKKNGNYYGCFFQEIETKDKPKTGKECGVDVGIDHFLVTSDEMYIDNPKYFREAEVELKMRQQRLARRKKGSVRRNKAKHLVAKTHEKIANQRRDFLHKIAKILIDEYDTIVVEKLIIKNMIKNKHLSKSISDAGWGMFLQILKSKAEEAGKRVIEVDPKGTSQMCSTCGEKVKKSLAVRIHDCPYCSTILNRDFNASLNILNKARTEPSVLACL
jgi:putative transposase